jgi:2-iminobutanoate/2-iminopropanoate deaminase
MINPISKGTTFHNLLFISGIPPTDRSGNFNTSLTFAEQAETVIKKLQKTLEENKSNINSLLFVYVYLSDIELAKEFNSIYRLYFSEPFPARKIITTQFSCENIQIEISGIAVKSENSHEIKYIT